MRGAHYHRFRQISEQYLREMIFCVYSERFRSLSSAREKWEQQQKC